MSLALVSQESVVANRNITLIKSAELKFQNAIPVPSGDRTVASILLLMAKGRDDLYDVCRMGALLL